MRPPVAFDVVCCHLVAYTTRQSVAGTVPKCIDKKNCLSGDRSFCVDTFSACTHRSRECIQSYREGNNSIISMP